MDFSSGSRFPDVPLATAQQAEPATPTSATESPASVSATPSLAAPARRSRGDSDIIDLMAPAWKRRARTSLKDLTSPIWKHVVSSRWLLGVVCLIVVSALVVLGVKYQESATNQEHHRLRVRALQVQVEQQIGEGQRIGIPATVLDPFRGQEGQILSGKTPRSWFPWDTQTISFYTRQTNALTILLQNVKAGEALSAQQIRNEATFQVARLGLLLQQSHQIPLDLSRFSTGYDTAKAALASTSLPSEASKIRQDVQELNTQLESILNAQQKIRTLGELLTELEAATLDTARLKDNYVTDQQAMKNGQSATDFVTLNQQLDAHIAQAQELEKQAIPRLGAAKLAEFRAQLDLALAKGIAVDAGLQQYESDHARLSQITTLASYNQFAADVTKQSQAIEVQILQIGISKQLGFFSTLIAQAAQVTLPTDALTSEYNSDVAAASTIATLDDATSLASTLDNQIAGLRTTLDRYNQELQAATVIYSRPGEAQNILAEVRQALIVASAGNIPVGPERAQLHRLALQLDLLGTGGKTVEYGRIVTQLNMINAQVAALIDVVLGSKVVTVSLDEQAARMYLHGHLIYKTLVTTGRPELPTVTGIYHIYTKVTPWRFHSPWPKGSPYWYPDSDVQYWMPFYGGYGLHDSPWRGTYGPGTNLPHYDPLGEDIGTHGCVNFPAAAARWLWNWTDVGTTVLVY